MILLPSQVPLLFIKKKHEINYGRKMYSKNAINKTTKNHTKQLMPNLD